MPLRFVAGCPAMIACRSIAAPATIGAVGRPDALPATARPGAIG